MENGLHLNVCYSLDHLIFAPSLVWQFNHGHPFRGLNTLLMRECTEHTVRELLRVIVLYWYVFMFNTSTPGYCASESLPATDRYHYFRSFMIFITFTIHCHFYMIENIWVSVFLWYIVYFGFDCIPNRTNDIEKRHNLIKKQIIYKSKPGILFGITKQFRIMNINVKIHG